MLLQHLDTAMECGICLGPIAYGFVDLPEDTVGRPYFEALMILLRQIECPAGGTQSLVDVTRIQVN